MSTKKKPSKKLKRIYKSEVNMRFTDSQEDYISFFFFVPHLNASTSPKLMTKSSHTYYIYVGYILGTPLILTNNALLIDFSVNASWCCNL